MSEQPSTYTANPILEAFDVAGETIADFDAMRTKYETTISELQRRIDQIERTPARRAWLTRKEAAAYLGMSVDTLDRYREEGFITTYRLPYGDPRFDPNELDEFLRADNEPHND